MKAGFFTTGLFLVFVAGSAQTGNFFFSHYSPDEERINMVCFDMVQDERGVFYFATQAGILQFDGRNWDILSAEGTIYSLAISASGEIYAAGSRGFGKIVRDDQGLEKYAPILEQADAGYIFQIVAAADKMYFLGEENLFEMDAVSGAILTHPTTPETGPFVSIHEVLGHIFVGTERRELYRLQDGKLTTSALNLEGGALTVSVKHANRYLLITDANRLYLCESGFRIRDLALQDSSYLNASGIVNATWVNEHLVAVGTLRGGVVFINPVTGRTQEIVSYSTGLPDNEVFTLITDRNLNVWVSHAYGFTRISPYLPFRSFHNYPGLQGNLLCATTHNSKVYVGTSLGLYSLDREEFYDEISHYVQVPVRRKVSEKQAPPVQTPGDLKAGESEKGGLLRFLKRRKPEEARPGQTSPSAPQEKTITTYKRELRTKRILRSSYYTYRRIEGVDAKISQLIHWKGKLIASGLGGAFEIEGNRSRRITSTPIRFLFASEHRNRLIASTYDDRLVPLLYDGRWVSGDPIENISEPITFIFEEGPASVWFCGFDKVFRYSDAGPAPELEILSFTSSNFDRTIGLYVNNEVIIASSAGFFYYNRNTRQLEKGDTLRKPVAYFANADNLWFRDRHNWYTAGTSGGHQNLQLLNLFSNLRVIDSDPESGALWIITGDNELLQFSSGSVGPGETIFPLILKAIRHEDIVTARNYLKVEQDESAFVVEVVKPDYIGNRFVEYRFRLEGLHQEWSDWSTQNNVIRFPYLPSGEYLLNVQSRDVFGRIGEMDSVRLNITPPYWRQPWFYAAQFSVFVFLVLLSFRLSYRFLIVSRLLSLLSIIIFIEFIQTTVGETFSQSSPAIDFGIQVFVAMLILPVEGFLRRLLLQAIAKRNEARFRKSLKEDRRNEEQDPVIPIQPEITSPKRRKK